MAVLSHRGWRMDCLAVKGQTTFFRHRHSPHCRSVQTTPPPSHLSQLPGDADGPAEPVTADQQGLHGPAPEVSKRKYIKVADNPLPGDNVAVHSVLLFRVKGGMITNDTPGTNLLQDSNTQELIRHG